MLMKYITNKYVLARTALFSKTWWQKFIKFTTLPEMKISKTVGFIVSILL